MPTTTKRCIHVISIRVDIQSLEDSFYHHRTVYLFTHTHKFSHSYLLRYYYLGHLCLLCQLCAHSDRCSKSSGKGPLFLVPALIHSKRASLQVVSSQISNFLPWPTNMAFFCKPA